MANIVLKFIHMEEQENQKPPIISYVYDKQSFILMQSQNALFVGKYMHADLNTIHFNITSAILE